MGGNMERKYTSKLKKPVVSHVIPQAQHVCIAMTLDFERDIEQLVVGEYSDVFVKIRAGTQDDSRLFCHILRPIGSLFQDLLSIPQNGIAPQAQFLSPDNAHNMPSQLTIRGMGEMYESTSWLWRFTAIRTLQLLNDSSISETERFNSLEQTLLPFCHTWESTLDRLADESLYKKILTGSPRPPQWSYLAQILGTDYFADPPYLIYGTGSKLERWIVSDSSVCPLITEYFLLAAERGNVVKRCNLCNRFFIASSYRFDFCSSECRDKQRNLLAASRRTNPVYDNVEKTYRSNYASLKRLFDKLVIEDAASKDVLQQQLADFSKAASNKKREAKSGKISLKEFNNWLFEAQNSLRKNWIVNRPQ